MKKNFPGILFLVVGNSGSGKDSIIQGAVKNYPQNLKSLYAPKRYITRPPSKTEKNIFITPEQFDLMVKQRKFALKWQIYGFNYGVPIEVDEWLQKGHPVVVNVSRTIIKKARTLYRNLKVVFIYVPFEVSVQRLKKRGRETEKGLNERIRRAKSNQKFPSADYVIDNSGDLDFAVNKFLEYLKRLAKNFLE